MKLAPNDNCLTEEHDIYRYIYIYTIFKVINKFEKKNFFCYKCANFVPVLAGIVHMNMQSLE